MQNKINKYESATVLVVEDAYNHGQQLPILLHIDWEEKEITVRVKYERNSIPGAVWHGRQSEYTLPGNVDATELREWVQDKIIPLANKIVSAYSTVWDGSNHVGQFEDVCQSGESVEQIQIAIDDLCFHDAPELSGDSPGLWDVREWAQPTTAELNAETTDAQIETLAQDIESAAQGDNVVLGGPDLREWLTEQRDEMREKVD